MKARSIVCVTYGEFLNCLLNELVLSLVQLTCLKICPDHFIYLFFFGGGGRGGGEGGREGEGEVGLVCVVCASLS